MINFNHNVCEMVVPIRPVCSQHPNCKCQEFCQLYQNLCSILVLGIGVPILRFNPHPCKFLLGGLMIVSARYSFLTVNCSFSNGYVRKQPLAWKEYCFEYLKRRLFQTMNRCTGCRNITEIMLKHDRITSKLLGNSTSDYIKWSGQS